MNRRTTRVLFGLVFTLACGEWLVSPTIAQQGDEEDAPPSRVPPAAFLTGAVQATAMVDGLEVTLEGALDSGFRLVFRNPTSRPQRASFDVDCVQVASVPFARMMPPPVVVHSERVEVQLAAGATVTRPLEADVAPSGPPPDPNDPNVNPLTGFTTTSFRLRGPDSSPEAAPLAVLRWLSSRREVAPQEAREVSLDEALERLQRAPQGDPAEARPEAG